MTELNLLLGFLAFVSVRTDFVRRKLLFVAALVFWGLGRLLTEYTFKPTDEGTLVYKYASLSGYGVAVCLFLSVLFLFLSCLGSGSHRQNAANADQLAEARGGEEQEDRLSPSERLRKLVDEE